MRIIYVHHAERKISKNHNNSKLRQLEDITQNGIKEAELLCQKYINRKDIKAIYTSPYIRCRHTAEIINKYINVPIINDERFNEMNRDEEWQSLLIRNMQAIDDIVNKYDDDDTIICVTSGVNLSAFICYFYNIPAKNSVPWCQANAISPITFNVDKNLVSKKY